MATPILIMGRPGTGKTLSIRNLDPKTTFIIDADEKPIPLPGSKTTYKTVLKENGEVYCDLKIPNKEIYYFFRNMFEKWLDETIKGGNTDKMLKTLLTGNIDEFSSIFKKTVMNVFSYNDVTEDKAESFYHAFVLGILVNIDEEYEISSNRESGIGRYDISIIPKDINKKGIIIEFKIADKSTEESMQKSIEKAKLQIEEKKYETELIKRGIKDIVKLAIVFRGKEVMVESF